MSTDPFIGKKLGDYVIVDMLGNGGMARVYRGFDEKLNRYAAVKVFEAHLIGEGDQDEYRMRFQNEARAIARLSHPNIVGVYQFGLVGTTYYMAMSIVEGRDLRSHIKSFAKKSTYMPYVDMLRVIRDIGSALDYAHQEGVIHRDVKPSNIMVTPGGRAVLTDFGLALDVSEGTIGATFGSAHYIAPEQALSSAHAVPQSDLYSLGVVLFEMLTNRVPFTDPSAMTVALKHINDTPPPPSQINPNLSHQIDMVLAKALQKTPANRFDSGEVFIEALEEAFAASNSKNGVSQVVQGLPSWEGDSRPSTRSRGTLSGSTSERDTVKLVDTATQSGVPSLLDDLSPVAEAKIANATQIGLDLQKRQRRLWAVVGMAIIFLFAVLAVILLNTSQNQAVTNQEATGTAQTLLIITSTQAEILALSATQVMTATEVAASDTTLIVSNPSGTNSLLGEAATATNIVNAITREPTDTPNPTAIPTVTVVETVSAPVTNSNPEETSIVLRYNANKLVLLNQSGEEVDVSGLTFIQVAADGAELVFDTERWEGGSRSPASLPPGDCFEVLKDSDFTNDTPEYCGTRHAWSRVTFPRWFWVSDDVAAVFQVRRGDTLLATCLISAGECTLNVELED
jgi:serine/threonine protein kinase